MYILLTMVAEVIGAVLGPEYLLATDRGKVIEWSYCKLCKLAR